jgi:hypothetical protein
MVSGLGAAFGGVEVATHRMIGEEIELLLPCVRVSRPDHHLWDLGGLLSLPCRSRLPDLISCASSVVLRHSCTMFISCLFAGLPSCDHESLIRCINIVTERRCIWISRLQTERHKDVSRIQIHPCMTVAAALI